MDIIRQWELFNPDFPASGPLAVLSVDFNARTGSLRYLRQEVPLTAFTQTGPGSFQAAFNLAKFRGTLAWQVQGDGSCHVSVTGTWTGKLRGRPVRVPLPEAAPPAVVNPIFAGRSFIGFLATPRNTRGEVARGTLHLWSGEAAKQEAMASIKSNPPGWMMGSINGDATPGHARAKVLFASAKEQAVASARARGVTLTPGRELAQREFEAIWGRASGDLVYRATLSGMPVHSHGKPGPMTIQSRYELPALRGGGVISGGLMIGSGIYSATSIDGDRPVLEAAKALTASAEATGGIMYMSGALAEVPEAMAFGSGLARVAGGGGTVLVNSYCLVEDLRAGRTGDAVADSLGVTSGALLLIAPFTGPAAPIIAAIAFALMASQLAHNLTRGLEPGTRRTGPDWSGADLQRDWFLARPEDFFSLRNLTLAPRRQAEDAPLFLLPLPRERPSPLPLRERPR